MMALRIYPIVRSLKLRTCFALMLGFSFVLATSFCSGMEHATCYSNQPKINTCNIETSRIPMNPCSVIPKTNCYAPVIVHGPDQTGYLIRTEMAPVNKPSCCSAPVTKPSWCTLSVLRSDIAAPYIPARKCPTAPVLIPGPSVQNKTYCE